MQLLLSY